MTFIRTVLIAGVIASVALPAAAFSTNILLPNLTFPESATPKTPGGAQHLSDKTEPAEPNLGLRTRQ